MADTQGAAYRNAFAAWQADQLGFWAAKASLIDWDKPWDKVFDPAIGPYGVWFPGAALNISANCLDRHIDAGRGDQAAFIWDSPVTESKAVFTYRQLRDRVARFAGALAGLGVVKGDRVLIYMPAVPEAAIAMLACARLGAIHSVVFGGFAAAELAARIADAEPKVIVSASCGIEPGRVVRYKPLLDTAIAISPHKPAACVILQRNASVAEFIEGRDHDFRAIEEAAAPHAPVSVAATDPLYILYTSGTTGRPKGIVRDTGGYAVALANSMRMIFGAGAGDVFWAASDVGWVVGHSYIVYAPLLAGCTTVMYEGKPVGTPDPGAFWRVCSEYGVKVFFTAPTAIRAIKQQDPTGAFLKTYDLSKLEALFVAGERCDPPTAHWIADLLRKPVIDHWWQTETGWPMTASFREYGYISTKFGSGGRPCPGYDLQMLDDEGHLVPWGGSGNLAVRLPMPPGCAPTLWHNDEGFRTAYMVDFPGWYRTGDAGRIDEDGDVWVMGRTDDVINVAGHRLSTGAMEEVLAGHPDVAECAVIGVTDKLKGQTPMGLVVLKAGVARDEADVSRELVALVRDKIGPVAAFKDARVVARLPKTRSGKILRATLRGIADGRQVAVPATIDDPAVLEEIKSLLVPA